MKPLQVIDQALLDRTSEQAKASPRKRKNFNFHEQDSDDSHRLLNAIEPGTYIPPHRHADPRKDETMVVLRGRMGFVQFDEAGRVTQTAVLAAQSQAVGINIPHGMFHNLVALEPGTVFLEAKAGPYRPLEERERAPWAPAEGEVGANAYLTELEALFD